MKHLLLVAHGSRRQASNDEIALIAKKAMNTSQQFDHVSHAFLEICPPSIPDGIKECISKGATTIVVVPCFLSEGVHVSKDIPREVNSAQNEYPDISISVAPYIGASEELVSLILNLAEQVETL